MMFVRRSVQKEIISTRKTWLEWVIEGHDSNFSRDDEKYSCIFTRQVRRS